MLSYKHFSDIKLLRSLFLIFSGTKRVSNQDFLKPDRLDCEVSGFDDVSGGFIGSDLPYSLYIQ